MPAAKTLTKRHRLFVAEYIVDLNATQAMLRIGFKGRRPDIAASRLMQLPHVQAAVELAMQERMNRVGVRQDAVLQQLARIAYFDQRRLYDAEGKLRKVTDLEDDVA